MRKELVYGAVIVSLVGAALWFLRRSHDKKVDQQTAAPVLHPDERVAFVIDQKRHTVTRVDTTGDHKTYLNPHGPVRLSEKKDGTTVLVQRTWGTQLSPNIGGAFGSDFRFRVALGLNVFYIQRFELGGGVLVNAGDIRDTRLFASLDYNVYSNMLIGVGVDNQRVIHAVAKFRF